MHAIVHGADVQDRDGGVLLMATLFGLYPFLLKLYADGGYQGAGFQDALGTILKRVNVEIVKRSDQAQRFVVLPKRWIVNRRTMLPVWDLNGLHSLNVRAVGARILLRGSSSERVNLSHANQSRHKS
jgi:transposase